MSHRRFLKTHYQDVKELSKPLDDLVTVLSSSNELIDFQRLFFRFTLATTTALILAQPADFEDNEKNDLAGSFDHVSKNEYYAYGLTDPFLAYRPSQFLLACKNVKQYADGFVKRALQESGKERMETAQGSLIFVEDLFEELKNPTLVRDQLVNVSLAGQNITACF